jgi:beta-lactam-binding protein with PASTA domain
MLSLMIIALFLICGWLSIYCFFISDEPLYVKIPSLLGLLASVAAIFLKP